MEGGGIYFLSTMNSSIMQYRRSLCVGPPPHLGGGSPTWRSSFGAKRCHRPERFTSRPIPLRNGISPGRSTRRSANAMQVTNSMLVICSGGRHVLRRSTCNSLAGPKSPVPRHITPHSVTTTATCAPGSSFQTQYHKSIPDARQNSETWCTLNQRPCDMRSDRSRHSHLPVSSRFRRNVVQAWLLDLHWTSDAKLTFCPSPASRRP